MRLRNLVLAAALLGLAWRALAGVAGNPGDANRADVYARVRAMTDLGRALFADPALSGSGKLACASCHDPRFAYGPPNALAVQLGGADMRQPGLRAAPSLRYLQAAPAFTEH